jgi:flavin reductase (DIM6/NTAB) family NADH-FMN oxidoreductase RutF
MTGIAVPRPPAATDAVAPDAVAPDAVAPDESAFRAALRRFPSGVTVVATTTAEGTFHATTASSFTSVSLEPKLVLVCLSAGGRALAAILSSGGFSVNVLSEQQEHLARHFAGPRRARGAVGREALADSAVTLDCRTYDLLRAGDHGIVVGEVITLTVRDTAGPLVFHGGRFRALAEDPAQASGSEAA